MDKLIKIAKRFEKLAQEKEDSVWALIHDTFEPEGAGKDYPVVRHVFMGKTKEEAEGYYKAHTKTCEFMRECDEDGKWEKVECDTKKHWKKLDIKDI